MKKDLYWLRSGFFTVVQNLSSLLLSIGTLLLLVRTLSEHDYGTWILFTITATTLEIIRGGLIQNALIKYLASTGKEDHYKIISSSFIITGIITIFCILIVLSFADILSSIWKSPGLAILFPLYCINFSMSAVSTQFNCIIQANLQFKKLLITSFVTQFIFFSVILISYISKIKIGPLELLYVQMFNSILSMSLSYYFVKPFLFISWKIYRDWISKLFNYGKYAFGTSISAILSVTIDQMMLGAILSPIATANYNIAVRITNILDIPTNALAVIIFPKSAQRMETEGKEAIKYLYEKSVGTLLALLFPGALFLYLFSQTIVELVAPRYVEAVPLLQVTLLYCLLTPYGRQFGNILDSIGKTKLTFFVVLTVASLNIGLNYLFITRMGILGAAYATLLANIIGAIIGQYILRKELNISIYNTFIYAFRFYPEFISKYILSNKLQ